MDKKGGHGFTIVELLIVIVVVAILAAVTIVTYNGITKQTYRSRAQSELSSIAKATAIFQVENGRYPVDVSRGIPAEITPYINGSSDNWPMAPWPWAVNFDVNSSAYWCITGKCRAHPDQPDNYPGYCMNCVIP